MEPHEVPDPETEPVVSRALITGFAAAGIDLAVAFGAPVSEGQKSALVGFVSVGLMLAGALWARRHAYSPATVARMLGDARRDVPGA